VAPIRPLLLDIAALRARVDQGLLEVQRHGSLAIFRPASRWDEGSPRDPLASVAQGVVLVHDTGEVRGLPFPRLFGHDEPGRPPLPPRSPDDVTVLFDGAGGVSYRDDEGRLRFASGGRFDTPEAALAERMWARDHAGVHVPPGLSLLVEIIDPKTRGVVRYGWSRLLLLGIRGVDGSDWPLAEVRAWGAPRGLTCAEPVALDLPALHASVASMGPHYRGHVARWGAGPGALRVRFASAANVALVRLIERLDDRLAGDWWYHRFDPPMALPEEHQLRAERVADALDAAAARLAGGVDSRADGGAQAGEAQRWEAYITRFGGEPRPVTDG
jgi:RNA ligase